MRHIEVLAAASCVLMMLCGWGCLRSRQGTPAGSWHAWAVTSGIEWRGARVVGEPAAPLSSPPVSKPLVLHIGDSFVDSFFQQNLRSRFQTAGAAYVARGTKSTYTTTWAYDAELDRRLAARPALVIVTLGANEVDMAAPDAHARAVERLAHKIEAAGASCVWTTPPLWKADTGILRVIHDHCSPCLFFDSDAVLGGLSSKERARDGIHPNVHGGSRWSEAFWSWLLDHRDLSHGPWALVPFERRAI